MKEEALKLAKIFEEVGRAKYPYHLDAAEMLRKLVEELDRNKIYIQKMEDALGCDVSYYEPLNKPVNPFAWVDDCFSFFTDDDYSMLDDELKEGMIPLYKTPQTKPLSDEEIKEVIRKHWNREYGNRNMLTLCKAIEKEHGIK